MQGTVERGFLFFVERVRTPAYFVSVDALVEPRCRLAEIMFGDVAHGDKLVIVFFNLLAQGGDVLLDFFYTTIPPRLGKDFFLFRSVCVRSVLLLTRPAFLRSSGLPVPIKGFISFSMSSIVLISCPFF